MKKHILPFVFLFTFMLMNKNLMAQENYAVIYGKVTNSSGEVLQNVKIKVSGVNNFVEYSTKSGEYEFVIASNSVLLIEFSFAGYKSHQEKSMPLGFQQKYELNVILHTEDEEKE